MTETQTQPASVLLVVTKNDIASAQQFRAANLSDCVHDVRIATDAIGLGLAIQQALEEGHARALRLATPSSSLNALPIAFPINKARRLVAAHALLFALDGTIGLHWQHLQPMPATAFESIAKLLRTRATHQAFAPSSHSQPIDTPAEIAARQRWPSNQAQRNKVICLVNVSREAQLISLDWRALLGTRHAIRDLVTGVRFNVHGPSLELQPHQVMWATL